MEDQLPAWSRSVDLLGQAPQGHAPLLELGDQVDEVPQRAAETIEPPDDDRVAGTQLPEHLV